MPETAKDLSDLLTHYRQGASGVLSPRDGILGKIRAARTNLELLGVVLPHTVSAVVTKGPGMPAPDSTEQNATDADKPWTKPDQGENRKFTHPNKLLALVAAFQALETAMSANMTFKGYDGSDVTMPVGAALAAIL